MIFKSKGCDQRIRQWFKEIAEEEGTKEVKSLADLRMSTLFFAFLTFKNILITLSGSSLSSADSAESNK